MTPFRVQAPFDWDALLALIRTSFAGMDGRIDPPSSMHRLTADDIARQAQEGEVWAIGRPPVACLFLTVEPDALYLHKLAVAPSVRRQGHARRLIAAAETCARALGLSALRLQTRVELRENHAVFVALGFAQTEATAHAGFTRPTSLTFCKRL